MGKREGGSDPRTPEGFGRLDSRTRGVATASARYFRPYSGSVSAIVISRRIIEMHRRFLELIAELIAEPLLQKSLDSSSSFLDTFLGKSNRRRSTITARRTTRAGENPKFQLMVISSVLTTFLMTSKCNRIVLTRGLPPPTGLRDNAEKFRLVNRAIIGPLGSRIYFLK